MKLPARFLNHSCDPNVVVGGVNDAGSYDFVALRDIDAGEVRANNCALYITFSCVIMSFIQMNNPTSTDNIIDVPLQEVRFDYETTEYEVGAFSQCHCGATSCRGEIRGYKHNGDVILQKYGKEHVAEYLMDNWEDYLVEDK